MDSNPRPASQDEASMADVTFSSRGCCCFWIPWSDGRSSSSWERIRVAETGGSGGGGGGGVWWKAGLKALMKVREWSEIVAGPRWKTFIRRFNRNHRHGSGNGRRFGYDPLSYARNFDEGNDGSPDRDIGYPDFSARFVAPPVSAKSSMDLGGRDAPPLFAAPATAVEAVN